MWLRHTEKKRKRQSRTRLEINCLHSPGVSSHQRKVSGSGGWRRVNVNDKTDRQCWRDKTDRNGGLEKGKEKKATTGTGMRAGEGGRACDGRKNKNNEGEDGWLTGGEWRQRGRERERERERLSEISAGCGGVAGGERRDNRRERRGRLSLDCLLKRRASTSAAALPANGGRRRSWALR